MPTEKLQFLLTADDKASRVFAKVRGELDSIKGGSAALRSTLGLVGPSLLGAFSVAAITGFVRSTINGIDALNDLKDATGASIENLSALEDVALRTGTSLDTAGAAVVKLNQALNTASDPNSGAAQALKALGLSVEELKRQDPVLALQQVGIALNRFADDGNKGRIILELLGRSAKDLAPLLKDLADAGKLNATVTTEQAEAAEQFNKELFALQKNATDLARSIAGPVVGAFNSFAGAIGGQGFTHDLDNLLAWTNLAGNAFRGVGVFVGGAAAQAAALARGDIGGAAAIGQAMLDDAKAARQEFERAKKLKDLLGVVPQASYSNEGRNYLRRLGDVSDAKGDSSKSRVKAEKGGQSFVGPELPEALADALKRLEQSDEAKLARLRAELQQLASIAQSGGAVPNGVFAQLGEDIARLDPAGRDAAAAIEKLADDQKRLQAILGDTPTGKMQALLEQIGFINAQFSSGNIQSAEQWAEAVRTATGTMNNDITQALDNNADAARELGLTFSSAFEDAIVGGSDFRDVLAGLEQDLLRIGTRKLITEPLTDVVSGLFGGAGGFSGIGSSIGSLFSGTFADGGFIPPGRWGIAGEEGPEPVFGGRTGATVRPAGGGMVVHNNFSFSGPVDRRTEQQVAAAAARGLALAASRNN